MTRLTPVIDLARQGTATDPGYRDEQIADVVGLVAGIEPADQRQRCLSAA
jgi:hypothetical protein